MKYSTATGIAALAVSILTNGLMAQGNSGNAQDYGKFLGDFRARVETADQVGRDWSSAFTLRSRVGYETPDLEGFKFFVEGEDIRALDQGDYNPYPVAGKTVISDPVGTELNRAQISYSGNGFTSILGRQRIILDGARFVGNVGWRQNEQTYDAFTVSYTENGLRGYYGYIDEVQRIFGDDAPSPVLREFESDSHILNGSYTLENGVKIGAYAYLLEFSNSAANSTDTAGINVSGKSEMSEGHTLNYYLEYANQTEGRNGPTSYSASYWHAVLGTSIEGFSVSGGYEVLGSDNGVGFKTPLATLHKFNGWADGFLSTPGSGLEDIYITVGTKVDDLALEVAYHKFYANKGSASFGDEWDLQATYPINKQLKLIAKAAYLDGESGIPGNQKLWFEADFTF